MRPAHSQAPAAEFKASQPSTALSAVAAPAAGKGGAKDEGEEDLDAILAELGVAPAAAPAAAAEPAAAEGAAAPAAAAEGGDEGAAEGEEGEGGKVRWAVFIGEGLRAVQSGSLGVFAAG